MIQTENIINFDKNRKTMDYTSTSVSQPNRVSGYRVYNKDEMRMKMKKIVKIFSIYKTKNNMKQESPLNHSYAILSTISLS